MAFYENILDYLTDKSRELSARATIFILGVLLILLIDNITGFSYYYNKERQVVQLKSVTELLKDSTIDSESRKELMLLQKQSFKRKNILDHSFNFIDNISRSENLKTTNTKSTRNNYWFLATSSGLYILIAIVLIPILLFTVRKTSFLQLLAMVFIFAVVMFFTSWFNYWLFDKIIPDELWGSWTWNYIVNFVLQVGLGIGLYWTSQKVEKINKLR